VQLPVQTVFCWQETRQNICKDGARCIRLLYLLWSDENLMEKLSVCVSSLETIKWGGYARIHVWLLSPSRSDFH